MTNSSGRHSSRMVSLGPPYDPSMNMATIMAMSMDDGLEALGSVLITIASLPRIRRRKELQGKDGPPDERNAATDPYLYERILLRMQKSDLERRLMMDDPTSLDDRPAGRPTGRTAITVHIG